ncbi:hypothetical protein [Shewanella waksmanii]|uniref:hypothetical protein n=1 Tax=Shewanella waksmanii TaxID=213783 RepID=UPI00373564B6
MKMLRMTLFSLIVLVSSSGCAQHNNPSALNPESTTTVTHRVHQDHTGCDLQCELRREQLRRDIEDRAILDEILEEDDGAVLY